MGLQLIRLSAYVAFRVTTHVAQVEFQPSPWLHVTLDGMVESKLMRVAPGNAWLAYRAILCFHVQAFQTTCYDELR